MKKNSKKITGVPAHVSTFSPGLIYFANPNEEKFPVLESLIQSSRKFRILVVGASAENQMIKNWLAQEKVICCAPNELARLVDEGDADYWLAADQDTEWNINKTLHSLRLKEDVSLYLPDSEKIESGKPSLATYYLKGVFSKNQAFFTPSTQNHSAWKAFLVEKNALVDILNQGAVEKLWHLFHRICLANLPHSGFELIANQYPKYWKETGKSIQSGLKSYLKWFFPMAIQTASNKSLDSGLRKEAFSRFLFAGLFLLSLIVMPILSLDMGISWDEKLQYEYAQDIYAYLISFGEDQTIFDFQNKSALWQPMQFYGSFFDVITVALVDIFEVENVYELRHVVNAFFGAFGLLFAGLFARAITGNWLSALLSLLFLVLTPSYFGHSLFNPKDVPFATGFFMAMYYMVLFIKELPKPRFSTILLFSLGIALSISIRVGGILIYPYLLLFAGIKWLGVWRNEGKSIALGQFKSYVLYFIPVLVGGYFLGILFWPYALQDPLANPLEALKGLSNVYYTTSYETFEGVRTYMSKVPWYYSIKLIALGAPLVVLLGFVLSLTRLPMVFKKEGVWALMLLFMLLFPPLYAAYKESMLYNGWRHWFFVYVNLVVMAAIGWTWLINHKQKAFRYASVFILFLGLGNMMWWMVRSHPNQYVYFNELTGGLKGAYGYYETDYYSNTMRQATEWFVENELPKLGNKKVVISTNNEPLTAQYYMNKYTDSVDVIWTREYELTKKHAEYSFFTSRTMSKTTLLEGYWPPKGTIHTISVDGVPLMAIVKHENYHMADGYQAFEKFDFTTAASHFAKAVEYNPENEEAWRLLAAALNGQGSHLADSAKAAAWRSVELLPENFIAYDVLGMIYSGLRQFDTANVYFTESIKYKINYTNAHYNRGIALFNLKKFVEAVEEFENSIRYGGQQPLYYKLLGMSCLNLNRLDDALSYLQFAAENGKDAEAFYYLGKTYELKGNAQAATQMYQQAQQLGWR